MNKFVSRNKASTWQRFFLLGKDKFLHYEGVFYFHYWHQDNHHYRFLDYTHRYACRALYVSARLLDLLKSGTSILAQTELTRPLYPYPPFVILFSFVTRVYSSSF